MSTTQHGERPSEVFHLSLETPESRACVYATYEELRRQGPVVRAYMTAGPEQDAKALGGSLGRELYLVTSYEHATALLTDDRFSVDPHSFLTAEQRAQLPPIPEEWRPLAQTMLNMDPPDHTRLRRLVQPSFTPRKIEELRPRVQVLTDALLDAAEHAAAERGEAAPDRRMDLIEDFAYPLPLTTIFEIMGVPQEDQAMVRAWTDAWVDFGIETEQYRTAVKDFTEFLKGLFAEKRARPGDDLTTDLVHAEEEGDRLGEDELLSMVFILIFGGHLTTLNLIANGTVDLLTHPEQLARLKREPELIKNAVEEILRYSGPVEISVRHAKEDVELEGTHIPKGSGVVAVLAAADRDGDRFPRPGEFDIARPDANRHMAFTRGVHLCLGAPLARLEGEVALGTLFRRIPQLRLEDPSTTVTLLLTMARGVERLPVRY